MRTLENSRTTVCARECLCVCVCVCVCAGVHPIFQISQLLFTNFRECAFTCMCLCVCVIVEPIFSFPTSFFAYVHRCIPIAPALFLCAEVRARERVRERMCAGSCDSYLTDVGFCL